MTVGKPLSAMMWFAVPLLIGNVAQLMYNTADSIVVGKMISSNALAAVGVSTPIQTLFFVFFMTVGTGVSVLVSQYFGAKNSQMLSQTVGTALTLTLIVTLFITAIGIPLSRPILRMTKVTPELMDYASDYLLVMFIGTMGQGFYNILSGILRGMGESIFPLIVLIGTALLNVGLDILFVGPLHMEVAGAAIATIICQYISAAVCLVRLLRMRATVSVNRGVLRPKKPIIVQIAKIGLPSGVQQAILSTSYIFVQSLINSVVVYDASGVASYTIFAAINVAISKVDNIAMLPNQAFSMAGSTFSGQNIGAGRLDRVKQGFKIILLTSLSVSVILIVLITFFGGDLMKLFIDMNEPNGPLIIERGVPMQRIMVWCYLAMSLTQASGGVLRGAGDTFPVMCFTIIGTVFMRMPMAYFMVRMSKSAEFPAGNPAGVYWSMLICFSLVAGACGVYYATGRWKRKAIARAPADA
ncbi:MAG: MATE family efflux transporter [Oscillospiraceae bacterium]|jgi:putative MATE family efflux protein|nr:MATE family efflux transporter [Oscillospiraceae bacterium]